jgi:hypothetical protein
MEQIQEVGDNGILVDSLWLQSLTDVLWLLFLDKGA